VHRVQYIRGVGTMVPEESILTQLLFVRHHAYITAIYTTEQRRYIAAFPVNTCG